MPGSSSVASRKKSFAPVTAPMSTLARSPRTRTTNNVSVLIGGTGRSFGAATNFAAGDGPSSVAVGDFNGDQLELRLGQRRL